MKKGDSLEMDIQGVVFPGKAWGMVPVGEDERKCWVKDAIPGQRVQVMITKKRSKKIEGRILSVLQKAPEEITPDCPHFGRCGGCTFQNLPYATQLAMKNDYVMGLLEGAGITGFEALPIVPSPEPQGYRNKMEYSFGDDTPGGPLLLGLHEKGSFYNILPTPECTIVDGDFSTIQSAVAAWFAHGDATYFHKRSHEGFLRHLVVRKGKATGEILINLVTTTQGTLDGEAFVTLLLGLPLMGKITGILHTINDGVADMVKADTLAVLYGEDLLHDRILGLDFEISTFSFFQTNTLGAEKLYSVVRDFVGDTQAEVLYDLYCGTGTIAQIMAPIAKTVVGIELVEEAVDAAKANALRNGLTNCTFIAGDVMEKVAELTDRPDVIILDPPRDGIHPKAIFKIIDFAPDTFVYVSCKASSLARDLPFFTQAGYRVERVQCVDMFAGTVHVETVVLMSRVDK